MCYTTHKRLLFRWLLTDFEQFKKISRNFGDFKQLKKANIILLNLNWSKKVSGHLTDFE